MTDQEKLKTLIDHWIEHNEEHGDEFAQWAQKAKDFGAVEAHKNILEAVKQLSKANEFLASAAKDLASGNS